MLNLCPAMPALLVNRSLSMLDHMVCTHAHFGNSVMAEAAVDTEYVVV